MPRIDNQKFYISATKKYGTTAKGVNWASKENQEIRFEIIVKLLPTDLKNFSIVDAGCGFGDFYLYLKQRNKLPKEYIGIDSLSQMSLIASNQTDCQIITANICKDRLPIKDYYICSGALNILTKFETYQFIYNCYKSSKIGFVFNILYGDKESEVYNYMNKMEIEKLANNLSVTDIEFFDGYLDSDVTVVFLR